MAQNPVEEAGWEEAAENVHHVGRRCDEIARAWIGRFERVDEFLGDGAGGQFECIAAPFFVEARAEFIAVLVGAGGGLPIDPLLKAGDGVFADF